jgi:hypothetical protein
VTAAGASERFERELLATFEVEPVEDGYVHAAEVVIDGALRRHGAEAQRWLDTFLDRQNPASGAAAIRCVGRLKSPGTVEWRLALLGRALKRASVEIRDAAVQAAELWGDQQAVEVLRRSAHAHREPWLREYVARIARDLLE